MNKKFKIYALAWLILLALFNVICFVTPSEAAGMSKFGGAFWAGYISITIAFIGQLVCAYVALNTDNKTKIFYNIPIIRISYAGLILTIIFGTLCMIIPNFPNWAGILVCLIILVATAIPVIKAKAAADTVEGIDRKIKAQTLFVKSLTADAESLCARAKTDDAKAACKKVYEAVRYSDPMSNDALAGVESQITLKFSEFSASVANDADNSANLADELCALISDRNAKCKILK